MGRKKYRWNCVLQAETGEMAERTIEAYWDPEKVTSESIAKTAAAEEFMARGKTKRYAGISAQLVPAAA